MNSNRLLFALLLWMTSAYTGSGQEPFIKHYAIGGDLTEMGVEALAQDKQGYLWIGSERGLYRFDGEHFTLINGSAGKKVCTLHATDSGLWVGFADGALACVDNQFKSSLTFSRFRQDGPIRSMYASSADSLWVGGEGGLYLLYKDSLVLHLTKRNGLSDDYIYSIQPLVGNGLLLGTDKGLNWIDFSGKAVRVEVNTTREGLPDNIVRVIKPSGRTPWLWLGFQQHGLALCNIANRDVHRFPELDEWAYGQVNDILPISAKLAWVLTDHYLIEIRLDADLSIRVKAFHYPERRFKKLICDYAGNLWAATDNGINLISARYLNKIQLPIPYRLDQVTALAAGPGSMLWLAQGNRLFQLKRTPGGAVGMQLVFESRAPISSLYSDYSGRLWLGTLGDGLWWQDETGIFHSSTGNALLEQSHILSITGSREKLWVAALPGLLELSLPGDKQRIPRFIRHLGKRDGAGSDYIYFLLSGKEDALWVATDGAGIRKMDYPGDFSEDQPASVISDQVVYSVAETKGMVWVGTPDKGLFYFNSTTPEDVQHKAWPDVNFTGLTANASGQVFAAFERCVNIWYPESRQFRHFNQALEIGIDSLSKVLNCMTQDASGNVYIPYGQGLLVFPAIEQPVDIRPNIFITRVNTALDPEKPLTGSFQHTQNYFNFIFEGINFTNPERLQYRYMLEGLREHWIYTSDESVTFPNLPPGNYTFRVQSSLDNDFSLAREALFTFTIHPPYWNRPIFLIALAALCCFLLYRFIKIRDKNQKAFSQLKQERMHFEYEQLKSQVNPHFLFNSLNTLGHLIEENTELALSYTESLADLYKNILKYRNQDLILLEEEIQILEGYLRIQQGRFGKALQYELDIPESLRKTKKIVPMGLQMLVENALKHNIVSLTQPLKIKIRSENEYVVVLNPVQQKINPVREPGVGLQNIQHRYALLTKRRVLISRDSRQFTVKLPLL